MKSLHSAADLGLIFILLTVRELILMRLTIHTHVIFAYVSIRVKLKFTVSWSSWVEYGRGVLLTVRFYNIVITRVSVTHVCVCVAHMCLCAYICITRAHYANCYLVQFFKLPLSLIGLFSFLFTTHFPLTLTLSVFLLHSLSALAALTALRRLHRDTRGCAR